MFSKARYYYMAGYRYEMVVRESLVPFHFLLLLLPFIIRCGFLIKAAERRESFTNMGL